MNLDKMNGFDYRSETRNEHILTRVNKAGVNKIALQFLSILSVIMVVDRIIQFG